MSVPVEYCQYIHIKAKSYPDMTQNVHVYIGVSMGGILQGVHGCLDRTKLNQMKSIGFQQMENRQTTHSELSTD